ncbi:MAG: helix-turn-helix domain-containing protein [Bacteroidales bacterium]|nr:helix-turn-helix domain-containing protein [Bacteroidales bacterium]
MGANNILSESVFLDEAQFIIRDLGQEICTGSPFRTKGGIIFLCTGGKGKVYLNTSEYDISAGCESIILPESTILFKECSDDLHITIFCFSDDMLSQASRKFSPDFFSYIAHTPVYRHRNNSEETTVTFFSLLKVIQKDKHNSYRTIIATNILRSFMLHVYDKIQKYEMHMNNGMATSRAEKLYNEFMNLIFEYGKEHHDVAFYADKLCITTRYLTSITSAIANESPKQTIAWFLIQEIKILLTFSELTIQQISDLLHFPDQSHLGRFFKLKTGISPNSYRKQKIAI